MALHEKNYDPAVAYGAINGSLASTGTVANGSTTINFPSGVITTGSLTTGTAATTSFDLVSTYISAGSVIVATLAGGTNTGGLAVLSGVNAAVTGSATITIVNADSRPAGTALNGTLKINFSVLS